MRLLLIDSHGGSGEIVRGLLSRIGHEVAWVSDVRSLDCELSDQPFDCAIADADSLAEGCAEVVRQVRGNHLALGVIVIGSARVKPRRIEMLDAGADDVLGKPFDLDELAARIRSVNRRRHDTGVAEAVLWHGPLTLRLRARVATWFGRRIALSGKEFSLLEMLLAGKNSVLSRAQVHERLCGEHAAFDGNLVDVHIHHLRRKTSPGLIRTVRDVGYELAPVSQLPPIDESEAGDDAPPAPR